MAKSSPKAVPASPSLNHGPAWLASHPAGVILRVYAQPQASRTEVVGVHGTGEAARLKIRLAAPPVEGAANEELLHFLKKRTGLPQSALELLRGHSSRSKDVLFRGLSPATLLRCLGLAE